MATRKIAESAAETRTVARLVTLVPAGSVPPPPHGERDVVLEMWGRLDHVTALAWSLASKEGTSPAVREKLQQLADFANPRALYGRMQQMLVNADKDAYEREADLKRQLANVLADNRRLMAEARDAT